MKEPTQIQPRLSKLNGILRRYRVTRNDLREVLGVSSQALQHWDTGARKIKADNAIQAEKLGIPRWELRPDLWPVPPGATPARPAPIRTLATAKSARRKKQAIGSKAAIAIPPSERRPRGRSPGAPAG